MKPKTNRVYLILSCLFFALLFVPGICLLVLPVRDFSDNENRTLSGMPAFSLQALVDGTWQTEFETYLRDQFVGRDLLCQLCNTGKWAAGNRDFNGAYVCDNGSLCEKVTPWEIDGEKYADNLEKLKAFAEKQGDKKVTVMLIPSAFTLYKDSLPAFAPTYDSDSLFASAKETLSDTCRFVDLREPFLNRGEDGLFYRTDHHWTYKGASLAYELYCKEQGIETAAFEHTLIAPHFYGTLWSKTLTFGQQSDEVYAPVLPEGITTDHKVGSLYDEAARSRKDAYTYFLGGNDGMVTVTNPQVANGKKLLLVKDSFANSMVPYLTAHYSEIVLVDLRYYSGRLSRLMEEKAFDDILVIYSMTSFAGSGELGRLKL